MDVDKASDIEVKAPIEELVLGPTAKSKCKPKSKPKARGSVPVVGAPSLPPAEVPSDKPPL